VDIFGQQPAYYGLAERLNPCLVVHIVIVVPSRLGGSSTNALLFSLLKVRQAPSHAICDDYSDLIAVVFAITFQVVHEKKS
jgi:hypothetical protein